MEMNSLGTYRKSGLRAGMAAKRGDVWAWKFECDWFRRALALEEGDYKVKVLGEWNEAYREARKGE